MEEKTKEYFKSLNMEDKIIKLNETGATVEEAAKALNTEPARIAKTIALRKDDTCIVIVMSGNRVIDNKKYKSTFNMKARMLTPEEVTFFTGHTVGSVCPFAIDKNIEIYIDESIKDFDYVYPACGGIYQVIKLTPEELYQTGNAKSWVDISKERD